MGYKHIMNRDQYTKLEQLPNIGPALARDLRLIGIYHPCDLLEKDPYTMFDKLCHITKQHHDPCVLDVFISVVRFMQGAPKQPWWVYTVERKERLNKSKGT